MLLIRPHQWLKNLMLFFPPFLGGVLFSQSLIKQGLLPFAAFCAASSATYIFNDIRDMEKDRAHPTKCHRPMATGDLNVETALVTAILFLLFSVYSAWMISTSFLIFLSIYLLLSFLYSCCLKNVPILDIFCVASGFIIRLEAGGEAFRVTISPWLFLTVFLLALFLSTGKRICEQQLLGEDAGSHRKTLALYPKGFLESSLFMFGGSVLVTYTVYVVQRPWLVYTVPLCCFGLMRYAFRIRSGRSGDPTESLLRDPWLFSVGILWVLMIGWGVYGR